MAFEDARTAGLRGVVAGLSAMLALNAPQQASAQEVFAISLVTPGMNRTELTSVMGPPSYIQVKERREAWQYCPPRSFVRFIDDVLRRERLYVTVWLNRGRVEHMRAYPSRVMGQCEDFLAAFSWEDTIDGGGLEVGVGAFGEGGYGIK